MAGAYCSSAGTIVGEGRYATQGALEGAGGKEINPSLVSATCPAGYVGPYAHHP
ncbi:MAG: hypothetical protein HY459_01765 [Parcubacteria group bacterium]|nr:hypothetical protein [Parcubacteria group bacterium]